MHDLPPNPRSYPAVRGSREKHVRPRFAPGLPACINNPRGTPRTVKQARTCTSSKWSGGPSRRARRSGTRHWRPSNPRTWRDTTDRLRLAPAKSPPSQSGGALSLPHLTSPTKSNPPTARGNGNPPTTETEQT